MHTLGQAFIDTNRTPNFREYCVLAATLLVVWRFRYVTRRHLRLLDRQELSDVGMEASTRQREVAKWFWQP